MPSSRAHQSLLNENFIKSLNRNFKAFNFQRLNSPGSVTQKYERVFLLAFKYGAEAYEWLFNIWTLNKTTYILKIKIFHFHFRHWTNFLSEQCRKNKLWHSIRWFNLGAFSSFVFRHLKGFLSLCASKEF